MLFLESPWPILIVGLVVEAVLAIVLFRTGRGVVLVAMGGVALLVLLGVLIEHRRSPTPSGSGRPWKRRPPVCKPTTRSRSRPASCPAPTATGARQLTAWALSQAEFLELTIRNLDVKFNSQRVRLRRRRHSRYGFAARTVAAPSPARSRGPWRWASSSARSRAAG